MERKVSGANVCEKEGGRDGGRLRGRGGEGKGGLEGRKDGVMAGVRTNYSQAQQWKRGSLTLA